MRLVAPAFVTFAIFGATAAAAGPANDVRLAEAAMKRDTAAVRTLVDQKVDVNAPGRDGTPALHWLVRVDDRETARLLIRAGADTGARDRIRVTRCTWRARTGTPR
jgi:ankyrin repeat protein